MPSLEELIERMARGEIISYAEAIRYEPPQQEPKPPERQKLTPELLAEDRKRRRAQRDP